jgi:hypothetical protein
LILGNVENVECRMRHKKQQNNNKTTTNNNTPSFFTKNNIFNIYDIICTSTRRDF